MSDVLIHPTDPRWPEIHSLRCRRDLLAVELQGVNSRLAELERPEREARAERQRDAALATDDPSIPPVFADTTRRRTEAEMHDRTTD